MEIICNFGVRKNDKIYLNDSLNQYSNHNNYFKTLKGRYYKQKQYWIFNIKNLHKDFSENDIQKIIVADVKSKTSYSSNINNQKVENNEKVENSKVENSKVENNEKTENSKQEEKEEDDDEEYDGYESSKIDNYSQTYSDYFVDSEYSLKIQEDNTDDTSSKNISEDIISQSDINSENSNHIKNYLEVEAYKSKQEDEMSKISDLTNASKDIYEHQKTTNVFNTEYIIHKNINIISEYEISPNNILYSTVKKYIKILNS